MTVDKIIKSLRDEPESWKMSMFLGKAEFLCSKDYPLPYVYLPAIDIINGSKRYSLIDRLRLRFAVWCWKRRV